MSIITEFVRPPIPTRQFDYSATTDQYEPGDPVGFGETEAKARADLTDQLEGEMNDFMYDLKIYLEKICDKVDDLDGTALGNVNKALDDLAHETSSARRLCDSIIAENK
jgi:hypothetical protein